MPTIYDLPPETILRILEIAAEDPYAVQVGDALTYLSIATLRSACLVSKAWLSVAQPILWHDICIIDELGLELMLASPCLGRFRMEELYISYERFDIPASPYNDDLPEEDYRWLTCESLQGLKNLRLHMPIERPVPILPPTKFKLTSLELGDSIYSPSLVTFLFTSSSTSLTTLSPCIFPPNVASAVLDALPLVTNNLERLALMSEIPGFELTQSSSST
ncbi:hypothetical protein P7C70_g6111, partial [Phenoliferia sp. Uapishka_3]